jgi:hypothetical protein
MNGITVIHKISDRRSEGNALGNLGMVYSEMGELERALGCKTGNPN